jgi:hypothetical protein
MTDYQPYERLAGLTPATAHLDQVAMDEYLWASLYEYANQTPPRPEEIAEITHLWATSPEGYGSTSIAFLARLTDDRWAACVAWSDTSGFGCQQDVDWLIAESRDLAISQGLDKESRAHLDLSLPTETAGA